MAFAFTGCHRPLPDEETAYVPSRHLAAIDTLMQSQPDSALTVLLDSTMDDPYYQLLVSEVLYKNDYAQTNRAELLEAMAYFDSIHDPFLSARCHYMNGNVYFELDSVVPACAEFLKALEIMKKGYTEKDLISVKAKYMALTYTHLCELFSDQYLHEQALYFGKHALTYYHRYNAEPWHIAWMLCHIGTHYEMIEQYDSAYCYLDKAMNTSLDTNSLMYRDIASQQAFLLYQTKKDAISSLTELKSLLNKSKSEMERLARLELIGMIYYREGLFDSAWIYVYPIFCESPFTDAKKQSAMWLNEICKKKGNETEAKFYADYLAQFAVQNELQGDIKSKLIQSLLQHEKNLQDLSHKQKINRVKVLTWVFLGCLLFLGLLILIIWHGNKKKKLYHEQQITDLTTTLEDTKETLQKERELSAAAEKSSKANSFFEEPICTYILTTVKEQNFKSKINYIYYKEFALDNNQVLELRNAANNHYRYFLKTLKERYPKLTDDDLNYCCFYLLGLKEADVAALMQRSFSTVCYRSRKIKEYIHSKEPLAIALYDLINTN